MMHVHQLYNDHAQTARSVLDQGACEAGRGSVQINVPPTAQWFAPVEDQAVDESFSPSVKMIQSLIGKLKTDGAPGPNGLPAGIFKAAPRAWAQCLVALFNTCLNLDRIPESWLGSILVPILKGGDPMVPRNYRLIALLDIDAKLYARVLLGELEAWVAENNLLPCTQTGFRSGASTIDSIIALSYIREQAMQPTGPNCYCCFVDFSAAFDRVNRDILWSKLVNWVYSVQAP